MTEQEYKRGVRKAWLLALFLIVLVAAWTYFSMITNQNQVEPHFVQGNRDFVPASSRYGINYPTPKVRPQGE